jgi:hypothetical protein
LPDLLAVARRELASGAVHAWDVLKRPRRTLGKLRTLHRHQDFPSTAMYQGLYTSTKLLLLLAAERGAYRGIYIGVQLRICIGTGITWLPPGRQRQSFRLRRQHRRAALDDGHRAGSAWSERRVKVESGSRLRVFRLILAEDVVEMGWGVNSKANGCVQGLKTAEGRTGLRMGAEPGLARADRSVRS